MAPEERADEAAASTAEQVAAVGRGPPPGRAAGTRRRAGARPRARSRARGRGCRRGRTACGRRRARPSPRTGTRRRRRTRSGGGRVPRARALLARASARTSGPPDALAAVGSRHDRSMPGAPPPVRIVLLRPRNPENLGAVARAMKNFGLDDWAIVRARHARLRGRAARRGPRGGAPRSSAARPDPRRGGRRLRLGGRDELARGPGQAPARARRGRARGARARRGGRTAIVFGDERSGLTNEEVRALPRPVGHPVRPGPAIAEPRPGGARLRLRAPPRGARPRRRARRRGPLRRDGRGARARWRSALRDALRAAGSSRPRAARGPRSRGDAPARTALAPRGPALDGGAPDAREARGG